MSKPLEKVSVIPANEPQAPVILTPMALIERAMSTGNGMDMIDKFMDMQERWDMRNARKAFDEAVSAAKAEIPAIERNKTGHNSKRYADFAAIAKVVDPILGRHGLSYRFRTVQTDRISVTCILSHKAGHSEETTLAGPADKSGNKNDIQAIGSTLTYLQRYSLVQMLGLAAAADDDGKGAGADSSPPPPGSISQEQVDNIRDLLESKGASVAAFLNWAKLKRVEEMPAERYDECVKGIQTFRKA